MVVECVPAEAMHNHDHSPRQGLSCSWGTGARVYITKMLIMAALKCMTLLVTGLVRCRISFSPSRLLQQLVRGWCPFVTYPANVGHTVPSPDGWEAAPPWCLGAPFNNVIIITHDRVRLMGSYEKSRCACLPHGSRTAKQQPTFTLLRFSSKSLLDSFTASLEVLLERKRVSAMTDAAPHATAKGSARNNKL